MKTILSWMLLASPALGPLIIAIVVQILMPRSVWWPIVAAALAGAGTGCFLASAAGAMASAVSPGEAAVRGLLIGGALGTVIGLAVVGARLLWQRFV